MDLSRNNSIEKIIKNLDQSTSCREAIEVPESLSIDPPSYRDYDKKKLKSSIDSQVSRRCREAVEIT